MSAVERLYHPDMSVNNPIRHPAQPGVSRFKAAIFTGQQPEVSHVI